MDGLEAVLVDDGQRRGGWCDDDLLGLPRFVLAALTCVQ